MMRLLEMDRSCAVILATGTVFRKLLAKGIFPDYVIISDSAGWIYEEQLRSEEEKVPLLFLSTASGTAVKKYRGDKYIIYQRGFVESEAKAAEEGVECFETGGSVSTIALDIGIRLGCSKIVFLGLDLAYTDGKTHAEGAKEDNLLATQEKLWTESIYGDLIPTSRNWSIYRHWIEWRVSVMRSAGDKREVIDATEGGAKIKGLKNMSLLDVISA